MGKIFGISDLPVSTIMTPFEPVVVPQDMTQKDIEIAPRKAKELAMKSDRFTPQISTRARAPKFLDMRNGIGKLMAHFSKKV